MLDTAGFDRAEVIAEVRAHFRCYEDALVRNDVVLLNAMFLAAGTTVRFGLAEQNYGIDAIAAYRRAAAPVHPQRRLLRTVISSFGSDLACVSCEFSDPSTPRIGRQTQTWVRTAAGWRIACAHVSLSGAAP